MQKEIAKAVAQADVKEKLANLGFVPVASTPEEFGKRITSEIEKWGKVVTRREAQGGIGISARPREGG